MATAEQLAQPLSEVRQQLAEAQRLTMEAQRAGSQKYSGILGQVDPRTSDGRCLQRSGRENRRIQEYEGESLETFSDGMKIAVLSSHAPESVRNVVLLGASEPIRVSPVAGSSTKTGEESSRNPTIQV